MVAGAYMLTNKAVEVEEKRHRALTGESMCAAVGFASGSLILGLGPGLAAPSSSYGLPFVASS